MCPSKTYCTPMVEIKHRPVHSKLTLYPQAVFPAVIFRDCAQLHFKIKIKPIKVGRTRRQFWWFLDVSDVPLMASGGIIWLDGYHSQLKTDVCTSWRQNGTSEWSLQRTPRKVAGWNTDRRGTKKEGTQAAWSGSEQSPADSHWGHWPLWSKATRN